ncbi:hypothetical protein vBAmePPT11V19_00031 [Alteromonas phage vB_AmeP_PT11-V19]|nr:hypothetical protein vBAmePPT11V19_00031 [Alteromonas phage vB_AmeP_PT11-V19]
MSFFKASKSKEDLKQGGSTGYINNSGCYPLKVLAAFVSLGNEQTQTVDLYVDHEKQKQVLYGNMRIKNKDGSTNKIGAKVFNQLIIVAGLEEVAEPVEAELPIGKEGALKDVALLEDFEDLEVYAQIQMEYSVYNSNITEKKVIRGFYRMEDKASAEEIVNGEGFGTQFEKDEKYFSNVTYKDGLDAEAVAQWIKDNRPKGTGGAGSAGTSSTAKKAPSFGTKKKFGK